MLAPPAAEHRPRPTTRATRRQPSATCRGILGPYELIREIGRGGMGVVYEARQKGLDRSVAVKMILASHLASPELVRRFQAEAKAAARLRHSNIVHIHDVGQFHGQDFFAMEYIDGQSLAERIARGPVDVHDGRAGWSATVARAVEHLHQQGIIHRDLKPSNILLDADGQPYVTDFGLAKVFAAGSDMTATGVIAGTPSYMAPEQASGRRADDRPGHRRVQPRRDPLRVADRRAAVPGRKPAGHADGSPQRRSGHAADAQSAHPARPGVDLPEVSGEGAARSVTLRRRRWPTTWTASPAARCWRSVRPRCVQRFWSWTRRQPALASRLGALGLFYVIETVNYYCASAVDAAVSRRGLAGRGPVDRGLDRLPAVARQPAMVGSGLLRLGNARLVGPARGAAAGLRRGQLAGGRLPADYRRLGPVVSGAVRLVHHVALACVLRRVGDRLLLLAARVARGNVRRLSTAT